MRLYRPSILVAALFLILPIAARRATGADPQPNANQSTHVTLSIANAGSDQDVEKISTALKAVTGVSTVAGFTPKSKSATVTYAPAQVSVHQISQAVADVPAAPDKPYQASPLLHVSNLSDSATQDKANAALTKVTGVAGTTVTDAAAGTIGVQLAPLEAADKTGGAKGVTQDQLLKALTDAGLTASADVAPSASAQ